MSVFRFPYLHNVSIAQTITFGYLNPPSKASGIAVALFFKAFMRYKFSLCSFDGLTTPMLNEFIEKVVVHEADKSTGDWRQRVDIYFNLIGCFVPTKPEVVLTAGEKEKAQKALAARNREREQNKLRMRRVRAAQQAAKEARKSPLLLVDLAELLCYTCFEKEQQLLFVYELWEG